MANTPARVHPPASQQIVEPRFPTALSNSGRARHHAAHKVLMARSANMPPPPATFDPDKQYRVRLSRTVPVIEGDESHMLRPTDDVVVSGKFAQTIRSAIISAKPL